MLGFIPERSAVKSPRARKKLTPHELARFLRHLAATGNFALACLALGRARSGLHKRRNRDPAFDAECRAILSAAGPRRRRSGRIDAAAEHAFLAARAEGASIRAAASAAGFTHPSFYARARTRPAFAREMEIAMNIGADRRLWARIDPSRQHDFGAVLPIPPMTVEQAIFQLKFHHAGGAFQRSVTRRDRKPPPYLAEVKAGICARLSAFTRAMHFDRTGSWRLPEESMNTRAQVTDLRSEPEPVRRDSECSASVRAKPDTTDVTSDSLRVTDFSFPANEPAPASAAEAEPEPAPSAPEPDEPQRGPRIRRL